MSLPVHEYLGLSTQCIHVSAKDWDSVSAQMQLFERENFTCDWKACGPAFEVVTGKTGWAHGRGLHRKNPDEGKAKQEGDSKTPVGIFTLGKAFGHDPERPKFHWPFIALTEKHIAVDDPESAFYNQIMENDKIVHPDWKSAEIMQREDGLYKYGLVICHNAGKAEKGAGSCIFMHLWRGPGSGTEGCTAMPEERMVALLQWLKPGANPILIQAPEGVFLLPF